MAFNVENGSGAPLSIEDLGITLGIGEITDLSLRGDPAIIAISAQAGEEISNIITSGDLIIKDPFDGVTDLSVADGLAVARSINDPHWRLGQGARIGDNSDVNFTSLTLDDVQQFDGTDWINVAPAEVGAGASFTLAWRFSTTTTAADPGNGRFRYNNATLASVTNIYFDDNADGGFDVGTIFSLLATGSKIYIQQSSDATKAVLFTLTGTPVDNTGWWTVPVSVDDSGTLHDNNGKCAAVFFTSGGSGTDELVKVSSNDTTAGFLDGKLIAGTNISIVENDDGSDETLTINNTNTDSGAGTIAGASIGYHFLSDNKSGAMYDSWLGTTTRHIPSNQTPYVMPFDGIFAAIAYSNSEPSSDGDFEIYVAPEGSGASETLVFRWEIRSGRTARISLLYTAETFTIDWTGITGASLPTGAVPAAWFDVTTPDYGSITYRFWFDDTTTTPPAVTTETLVAISFVGSETDQAISDLVVTALIGADAEFAGAANGGGTTPLITTTMASKGEATDAVDGSVPTSAVFAVTTQGINGPMEIPISKGDKIAVLVADDIPGGGGVEPQDVVMSVYVQWTDEPQEESTEDYVGDF